MRATASADIGGRRNPRLTVTWPRRHSTFREVVRLRDIEERSNAEVAERLHISKWIAAVRLHRAHRLLRARLMAHR